MDLFASVIFTQGILPFLLVFVLVFAILQKSKILGEEKKQIDALIALAIALILVAVPQPRAYIVDMVPWLAVALVVLLIFMLIYGFVGEIDEKKGLRLPNWVRTGVLILSIIFVIVLVLYITGAWDKVYSWVAEGDAGGNILVLSVVGIALWIVLGVKKSGS